LAKIAAFGEVGHTKVGVHLGYSIDCDLVEVVIWQKHMLSKQYS